MAATVPDATNKTVITSSRPPVSNLLWEGCDSSSFDWLVVDGRDAFDGAFRDFFRRETMLISDRFEKP